MSPRASPATRSPRSTSLKTCNRREPPYLSPGVDPWVFLVIPRTYFRANIPEPEGGFVLAYNLTMFAIVAVCLAAIHLAFDERQRKQMKRYFASLIASIKSINKVWCG